jgi:hypothetical protein
MKEWYQEHLALNMIKQQLEEPNDRLTGWEVDWLIG